MKRTILAAISVFAAVTVLLTGCNQLQNAVAQVVSGQVTGEIGKTYATQWFEFTIDSIDVVPTYAGYAAAPGHKLIDVVITEKGTFDIPCPMGTFDFRVDHDDFEDWIWPLDPMDSTMMPEEFDLEKDEVVNYHMVYEVPDNVPDLKLIYIEVNDQNEEGNTFTINIKE